METAYASETESPVMAKQVKKKKIGFFKRWLLNSVKDAVEDERRSGALVSSADVISTKQLRGIQTNSSSIDQPERAIHFTVYNANGGRVIETRKYDRKTDRHGNNLYIITSDQDFGREIDKIITMEALKQ